MNLALVPVKRLGAAKSRLAAALPRAALDALTLAMLGDVLEALAGVPQLDRVVVVTPDAAVGEAARAQGAEALVRADPGLNASLAAAREALAGPGDALLVVLGDVAGARSDELASLFEALAAQGGRGVVLAPARDGGTAALLRAPADAVAEGFGPDSAAVHRRAARDAGVPLAERRLPSLAVDLDRAEDLEALLASDAPAPRTRALLARHRAAGGERWTS